ncbi:hypothetical protein FVE85_9526 [Porphyridium purpureum]|uniref:Uncharacterized protein n=1 Tax=Porphyridium purpureum TaxID=35688 RepID=A0A5J4YIF8_PORPP|nr:hypothetical protein FVE85_9526 [Porphyridium purpureum]|eukprot:POR2017..scf261_15
MKVDRETTGDNARITADFVRRMEMSGKYRETVVSLHNSKATIDTLDQVVQQVTWLRLTKRDKLIDELRKQVEMLKKKNAARERSGLTKKAVATDESDASSVEMSNEDSERADHTLLLSGINEGVEVRISKIGDTQYGEVYVLRKVSGNVLSLGKLRAQGHPVAYTKHLNEFRLQLDKETVLFIMRPDFVSAYPSAKNLKHAIRTGAVVRAQVSVRDVDMAKVIWGPMEEAVKSKTMENTSNNIPETRRSMFSKYATLHHGLMFVNGQEFLVSVCKPFRYIINRCLVDKTSVELKRAIALQVSELRGHGI